MNFDVDSEEEEEGATSPRSSPRCSMATPSSHGDVPDLPEPMSNRPSCSYPTSQGGGGGGDVSDSRSIDSGGSFVRHNNSRNICTKCVNVQDHLLLSLISKGYVRYCSTVRNVLMLPWFVQWFKVTSHKMQPTIAGRLPT